MKTITILKTALVASLLIPATSADELRMGRKMDLLTYSGDANVEVRETECVLNRHGVNYTQREWDRKDRGRCYYYVISNAFFTYNDDHSGQQHGPHTIVTRPLMHERLSAAVPDQMARSACVNGIASALERQMNGIALERYPEGHDLEGQSIEQLRIPQFEGVELTEEGHLVVDTAEGNLAALRNQSFYYSNREDESVGDGCNPAAFNQLDHVNITDRAYTRVQDPDAPVIDHVNNGLRNTGRFFRRVWEGTTTTTRRVINQ